jgi:hypothetical protein
MLSKKAAALLAGWMLIGGCHRDKPAPPPAPATSTASTTAATQATSAVLILDGQPVAFPPCRLRMAGDGSNSFLLYTDESAVAMDPSANTVFLTLPLDIDDISAAASASCHLVNHTLSSEGDSPSGLSLAGGSVQLVPMDVTIMFSGGPQLLSAKLEGTFSKLTVDKPPQTITVKGTLSVAVDAAPATTAPAPAPESFDPS